MEDDKQNTKHNDERQLSRKIQRPRKARQQKNQFRSDDDFNWGKILKVVLSWTVIIFLVFLVTMMFRTQETTEYAIDYTEYQSLLKEGAIKEADIKKSDLNNFDFHGVLKKARDAPAANGKNIHLLPRFTGPLDFP